MLAYFQANAQDSIIAKGDFYIGAIGQIHYINNNTTLGILEGAADCGTFTNGDALGWNIGISADYSVIPNMLDLSARMLYSSRGATLEKDVSQFEVFDVPSDSYVPYVQRHQFTATLGYMALDLGVRFQPFEDIPIYVRGSFDVGNPVFGKEFSQTEEIASPASVLFPNGAKRRITAEGLLRNTSTAYGSSALVGAEFELQEGLFISPEFGFRKGLNSVLTNQQWDVSSLFGGIAVRARLGDEKKLHKTPEIVIPPPPAVAIDNSPSLTLSAVKSLGLEARETVVTQTYPLLPYIFFDSSSSDLRQRYVPFVNQETFTEVELSRETLPTYYHILHIIGKRMKQFPNSKLTLTGASDGKESPTETARINLAQKRAERISNFLEYTWGIDRKRIAIVVRDMPKLPSNQRYLEGFQENRRVELSSDSPELLRPVIHSKFLEFTPIRKNQPFEISVREPESVSKWTLSMYGTQGELAAKSGVGAPPNNLSLDVDDGMMKKLPNSIKKGESLQASLRITRTNGKVEESLEKFSVGIEKNTYELSRLSLIVFDFNKFEITGQNKQMMNNFINVAIQPRSDVNITGSTDRLGEAAYNMELSQSRANAVRDYLIDMKPDSQIKSVRGVGASVLPFDNTLPEGRYYCRTVAIEAKTPL